MEVMRSSLRLHVLFWLKRFARIPSFPSFGYPASLTLFGRLPTPPLTFSLQVVEPSVPQHVRMPIMLQIVPPQAFNVPGSLKNPDREGELEPLDFLLPPASRRRMS
jgi:hypothetical protein